MREALASDRLEDFVRQAEARGVELVSGSELTLCGAFDLVGLVPEADMAL